MALTAFGKEIRKLRIERDLLLKNMADSLRVSPAFLSAVETGRKGIPAGWVERIGSLLDLSNDQRQALRDAAEMSANEMKINIRDGATELERSVAATLARTFGDLDEEKVRAIQDILNRRKA